MCGREILPMDLEEKSNSKMTLLYCATDIKGASAVEYAAHGPSVGAVTLLSDHESLCPWCFSLGK